MTRIILGSSSQNRQALLDHMGFAYEVCEPVYEEVVDSKVSAEEQVQVFALGKARSVLEQYEDEDVLVMGFDSLVQCGGETVGKPKTKKAALEMLQGFVGKPQSIITGVALVGRHKGKIFEAVDFEQSAVQFRGDITNCQIHEYLKYDDYRDKCGGYSVLGMGQFFLEEVRGDFQNIVGVPVRKLGDMIRQVYGKAPMWVLRPGVKS